MSARLRVKPTDVPVYNSDDEKFTIEMHYAGKLIYVINDELHYLVGEVRFWDWVDPDVISLFDIDRFLVDVGYLQQHRLDNMEEHRMKEGLAYYSYNENESLRNGLFEIRSNLDLHNMAKDVVKHDKIVKLFLLKTDEVNRAMNNLDPIIESSSDANEGKRSRKGKTYSMLSADGEESDSSYTSGFEEDGNEFSEEELVNVSDHENYVHIMKEREGNKENENTRVAVREEGQRSQDLHIDNDVGHEYNSEYEDSDELESIYSSDEDGQVERRRYPEFQAAKEMDNPSFCVEQTFSDFATLKKAIKNYSLINHRPLRFKHSDPKRLQVVCQTGCPWRIWASKRQDGRVQIKKAELEHSGCVLKYKNRFGDYKYIANKYVQRFQVDPEWSTRSVVQTVQEDLHMNISNSKAWRIRRTANKMVRGKEIEQYARLRDYCAEVRKSNVGSTIFVDTDNDSFFRRMYCCLDACKKGFISGCRKVICLDGCFLKTEYGGQLLSAIGIDANNGIFPIAYAVVRSEDEANWTWFLQTLRSDLNIPVACDEWTFMSDKQKVATYMKSYDFHVSPMVGHESWDRSGIEEVKAPRLRIDPTKKRGRRSTKRKKGREETLVEDIFSSANLGFSSTTITTSEGKRYGVHAVAAISFLRLKVEDYVHELYKTNHVATAYGQGIPAIVGRQAWPQAIGSDILPPIGRRMPGRPKKARRKELAELGGQQRRNGRGVTLGRRGMAMHCRNCTREGHNTRSCPFDKVAPAAGAAAATANDEVDEVRNEEVNAAEMADDEQEEHPPRNVRRRLVDISEGSQPRQKNKCRSCGFHGHNARTCPMKAGVQPVQMNVQVRGVVQREILVAQTGVGVSYFAGTGNTYFAQPQAEIDLTPVPRTQHGNTQE
ncbi:hypothetical protein LINPERHAP2_LOCUS335 [Linum perenne]